jgi:hypothetical protein
MNTKGELNTWGEYEKACALTAQLIRKKNMHKDGLTPTEEEMLETENERCREYHERNIVDKAEQISRIFHGRSLVGKK